MNPDRTQVLYLLSQVAAFTASDAKPEAAKAALELALEFAPVDELRQWLTEAAAARGNLIADLAEKAKFGS